MSSITEIISSYLIQDSSSNINYFTNRNGLQLAYNISIKKPDDKRIWIINQMWPPGVFILCGFLYDHLNVNTFKFEYSGNGNSQGEFTFAGYISDAHDINDAVNFLTGRGYEVEGIIGMSMCAIGVIIYSALYGQVKRIVSLSARFHMNILPIFLQEAFESARQNKEVFHTAFGGKLRLTWEMIEETISIDMNHYCERVKGDIYIIHGHKDEHCPYSDSLEYVKVLKEKCRGHFTLDCDHFYVGVFDEVVGIIENIMLNN